MFWDLTSNNTKLRIKIGSKSREKNLMFQKILSGILIDLFIEREKMFSALQDENVFSFTG